MTIKEISFVGTRNRGLSPDLKFAKQYLESNLANPVFRYLAVNENSKNRWLKKGSKNAKKEYAKTVRNALCVDASLPVKMNKDEEAKHVLISVPYDYQFKAMNKADSHSVKKKKTYNSFTHVITTSPFAKDLFEKCYETKAIKIDGVCTPMVWSMNDDKEVAKKRRLYEKFFPQIKGKKIMSILLAGEPEDEEKNPYEKLDLKAFLDSLDDEWFVFTNKEYILEKAIELDASYKNKFGFAKKMLDSRELLYFSDCVVTNSGMYASYFASKKKPIFCLRFLDNGFEKYMKKNYPSLYIKDLNRTENIDFGLFDNENKRFGEYFTYSLDTNPNEKIMEIFE